MTSECMRSKNVTKFQNRQKTFKVNNGVDLVNAAVESAFSDHLRRNLLCLYTAHSHVNSLHVKRLCSWMTETMHESFQYEMILFQILWLFLLYSCSVPVSEFAGRQHL